MSNNMNINGNGLSDADIKKYEELYRTGNKTVVNQVKLYCEQTNAEDELDRFESTMTAASNDTDVANTENKSFIGRIFDWFKDALGFNIDLDSIPDSDSPATLSSIDDTKGVDNIQANSTASVSTFVNEDGKEISDNIFNFVSAFEYFNDSGIQLDNDVLSLVIPSLSDSLESNTVMDIESFVNSIDFSNLNSDTDLNQIKSAIKSVLSNIAVSYGNSSNNSELSASDFASFSIVSNLMYKFNINDKDVRDQLSKIMSENVLNSSGDVDAIYSQIKELLGSEANEDYVKQMLGNVSKLNKTGADNTVARRDMWQFGLNTLKNYTSRIQAENEYIQGQTTDKERAEEIYNQQIETLNNQLINVQDAVIQPNLPSQPTNPTEESLDFSSLNETPPTMPTLPVAQSTSEQVFYENGNLKYEEIINTDGSTSQKHYYYHNGELMRTQEIVHYSDENYMSIIKDSAGNLVEVQKVFEDKENQVSTHENIYSDGASSRYIEKDFENGGRQSAHLCFDKDGNLVEKTISEYDAKGNSSILTYDKDGNLVEKTISEYDSKGNGSTVTYNKDGNVTSKIVSEFDENTKIKTTIEYSDDGNTVQYKNLYYFDEMGRIIKNEFYNSDDKIIDSKEYIYSETDPNQMIVVEKNSKGNVVQITDQSDPECLSRTYNLYDENDNQISSYSIKAYGPYTLAWNSNGIIKELHISSDSQFEAPAKTSPNHEIMVYDYGSGKVTAEFKYDSKGNLDKEIHYDKNGNVTSDINYYDDGRIYYQEDYSYDDEGNKKSHTHTVVNGGGTPNYTEYFDKSGNVTNADFYRIGSGELLYSEKYIYNEDGEKQYTENYDKDGKLEYIKLTKNGKYEAPKTGEPNSTIIVRDFYNKKMVEYRYDGNGNLIAVD